MPNWLETISQSAPTLGVGTGIGAFAMWLLNFIGGRMDKRADMLDAGTQRLVEGLVARVDELTKRVTTVERELADCQKKHAESEAKAARLEALFGLTSPGMRASFPVEKTVPVDMAVMAAKLDGGEA